VGGEWGGGKSKRNEIFTWKFLKLAESLQWWYAFDFVNNAKSELLSLKYSYGGIVQNAMFSGSLYAHEIF